jgi:hypothetical protein
MLAVRIVESQSSYCTLSRVWQKRQRRQLRVACRREEEPTNHAHCCASLDRRLHEACRHAGRLAGRCLSTLQLRRRARLTHHIPTACPAPTLESSFFPPSPRVTCPVVSPRVYYACSPPAIVPRGCLLRWDDLDRRNVED